MNWQETDWRQGEECAVKSFGPFHFHLTSSNWLHGTRHWILNMEVIYPEADVFQKDRLSRKIFSSREFAERYVDRIIYYLKDPSKERALYALAH